MQFVHDIEAYNVFFIVRGNALITRKKKLFIRLLYVFKPFFLQSLRYE